jgi:hypothetical protein
MRILFSNTRTANIAAAMPDFPVKSGCHVLMAKDCILPVTEVRHLYKLSSIFVPFYSALKNLVLRDRSEAFGYTVVSVRRLFRL